MRQDKAHDCSSKELEARRQELNEISKGVNNSQKFIDYAKLLVNFAKDNKSEKLSKELKDDDNVIDLGKKRTAVNDVYSFAVTCIEVSVDVCSTFHFFNMSAMFFSYSPGVCLGMMRIQTTFLKIPACDPISPRTLRERSICQTNYGG